MPHPDLHYRLTKTDVGSSVTCHTDDPELSAQLADQALELIEGAFKAMTLSPVTAGMVPEVLSAATLERIENLEVLLRKLRDFIEDHAMEGRPPGSSWAELVAEADDLLD